MIQAVVQRLVNTPDTWQKTSLNTITHLKLEIMDSCMHVHDWLDANNYVLASLLHIHFWQRPSCNCVNLAQHFLNGPFLPTVMVALQTQCLYSCAIPRIHVWPCSRCFVRQPIEFQNSDTPPPHRLLWHHCNIDAGLKASALIYYRVHLRTNVLIKVIAQRWTAVRHYYCFSICKLLKPLKNIFIHEARLDHQRSWLNSNTCSLNHYKLYN